MKRKTTVRSKRRVLRKRPIIQYVVNARAPKQVVWFNDDRLRDRANSQYSVQDLRILMVIDQFNVGGTETHVLAYCRELLRKGAHVAVAGKRGEMRDAFAALGCPVYEINFVTDQYLRNDADEQKMVAQLKQIMNTEGITVVHIHQIPSGHFAAKAAKQLCVPYLFTLHMLYQLQGDDLELIKHSGAVVCVSPSILKNTSVKGTNVHLIPNGIDTIQFDYRSFIQSDLRAELGIPDTAAVIMYAGRLSWEKADICRDMLEACKQLKEEQYPDLHFLIAGEGQHSGAIKETVSRIHEQTDSEFIHLLGNDLHISSYYSICDCFVGTGRAALEALASCRPVVAIGVKGFFGLVQPDNYQSAWQAWFGDHFAKEKWTVDKIKQELKQAINMPESERLEMGWVGRNFVKDQFNITRTTEKLMGVYANILMDRYPAYEV